MHSALSRQRGVPTEDLRQSPRTTRVVDVSRRETPWSGAVDLTELSPDDEEFRHPREADESNGPSGFLSRANSMRRDWYRVKRPYFPLDQSPTSVST
jgi:hypothetical protein